MRTVGWLKPCGENAFLKKIAQDEERESLFFELCYEGLNFVLNNWQEGLSRGKGTQFVF